MPDGQRAGEGGKEGKLGAPGRSERGASCDTLQALLPSGSVHVSLCGLFPPAPPQPLAAGDVLTWQRARGGHGRPIPQKPWVGALALKSHSAVLPRAWVALKSSFPCVSMEPAGVQGWSSTPSLFPCERHLSVARLEGLRGYIRPSHQQSSLEPFWGRAHRALHPTAAWPLGAGNCRGPSLGAACASHPIPPRNCDPQVGPAPPEPRGWSCGL